MDNKDGKKKESIDEILSDLNGLLNKMPSILDGIRMPELKPAEFPSEPVDRTSGKPAADPIPAPEPERAAQPPLASEPIEPSPAFGPPAEVPAEPAPDAADKTMVLPAFSGLGEGAEVPAQEKLVPQSFGDFMFGEKADEVNETPASPEPAKLSGVPLEPPAELSDEPLEPPVETPSIVESGPEKGGLVISQFGAPEEAEPEARFPQADLEPQAPAGEESFSPQDALPPAEQEPAGADILFPEAEPAAPVAGTPDKFGGTVDFGVPDIDAMLLMSTDEKPEPALAANPAPEPAPGPEAAAPREEAEVPPAVEPAPAEPGNDELAEFERQLQAAAPLGDAMENKPEDEKKEEPGGTAPEAAPEGLVLEPAPAQPAVEEPAALEPAGEIQLSVDAPEPAGQPQGEPELSVNAPATEAAPPPEAQPEGLVLEPASALFSEQPPAASGDETLVLPPSSGDEEKTVIYEPGSSPGVTSRSQSGDLATLAVKPVPEGIPAERVRTVVFLYAAEEKAFCASVLSELDAICLRSSDKPMFIKRASVKECDPGINGNYVLQTVADAGAAGLVCVGSIPQEKVFEIESAFSSAGKFFRHYDAAGFSHSVALDLVSDLILCC